jgi:hypothetical protein
MWQAISGRPWTEAELAAAGTDVKRLACYVQQVDTHLPFMTVHETAAFSHLNSTPCPAPGADADLHASKHEVGRCRLTLSNPS